MRILVATDGSDPAAIGLEQARDLATLAHGEIRIVAVLPPAAELFGGAWPAEVMIDPEPIEQAATQQLEERLRQEVERTPADLRPTAVLRRGRPADEIVTEATTWAADVIVVGSRGHGPLGSILLGSVSEEVVDRSPIPVLVARRPRTRRLVVAVDGSPAANAGIDFIARDSTFQGLDAVVVDVAAPGYPWLMGMGVADAETVQQALDATEATRAEERAAGNRATRILQEAGLRAESRHRDGDPADEIVRIAAELDADLIVIGSRGRTGLTRLVLGSVARQVLRHATSSVLVVHPAPVPRRGSAEKTTETPAAARLAGATAIDEVHGTPRHESDTAGLGAAGSARAPGAAKENAMKILLAYDGGEPARRALETAASIAKAMGGSVDVISVVPMHPGRVPIDPWDDRSVHDQELRDAHTRLADQGIATRLLEPAGDPAHEIELAARDYDMIVVGARRQGALGRMLQGSVSAHVATHADATVVVAR